MSLFWRVLIQSMQKKGWRIICCVPAGDPESEAALRGFGAEIILYSLDRKGLNPLNDLKTFFQLKKIFCSVKPDLLFATTIKPVIYGCMAAHACGVKKIFATITGLGYAFEADNPIKKLINRISRVLYAHSLKYASGIFFQNPDDARLFHAQNILTKDSPVFFARGTGVDTGKFAQAPLPKLNNGAGPTFLLIGRLLEAKGIEEYAKAARMLRAVCPAARFQLLGPEETGRGAIPLAKIKSMSCDIEYLGSAKDVRPHIAKAHVVVLPSWREGAPTCLMEAMSMGRPCVATNAPGCAEMVVDGVNGFLAEVKNPASLAAAMEKFIKDPDLIPVMGMAGRKLAEEKFDAQKVAEGIIEAMAGNGR